MSTFIHITYSKMLYKIIRKGRRRQRRRHSMLAVCWLLQNGSRAKKSQMRRCFEWLGLAEKGSLTSGQRSASPRVTGGLLLLLLPLLLPRTPKHQRTGCDYNRRHDTTTTTTTASCSGHQHIRANRATDTNSDENNAGHRHTTTENGMTQPAPQRFT